MLCCLTYRTLFRVTPVGGYTVGLMRLPQHIVDCVSIQLVQLWRYVFISKTEQRRQNSKQMMRHARGLAQRALGKKHTSSLSTFFKAASVVPSARSCNLHSVANSFASSSVNSAPSSRRSLTAAVQKLPSDSSNSSAGAHWKLLLLFSSN